jgi:hypothetical protein
MRQGATAAVLAAVATAALSLVVVLDDHGARAVPESAPACAGVDAGAAARLMRTYSQSGSFVARQSNGRRGLPTEVSVDLAPIRFTGDGESASLPIGPCGTIYRFRFPAIRAPGRHTPSPFRYVEVDWNTEGVPRGPNGSFISPHFDFHFYRRSRARVDATTTCVSTNGKTCDALQTDYSQMRRFLDLPPGRFVPPLYRPDVGSSIPAMGLHLLDMTFDYTVENVNHSPVLIYGTFQGEVLFAEASVTLFTLQDAMAAPGHAVSFPFRQPPRPIRPGLPWPTRFVIRYRPDAGTFQAGFAGFHVRGG